MVLVTRNEDDEEDEDDEMVPILVFNAPSILSR